MGGIYSSAYFKIESIKIEFLPRKIYGLFIGATKTGKQQTLKGAEAAQRLEIVFKGIHNVADTLLIPINLDYTGGVNKELIHSAIKGFNKMMKPGDKFFLFYTGHGGQLGSENTHSEFLACGPESPSWVYDIDLAFWLNEMKPGITKWVVLDSCHSGGFLDDFINHGLTNFSFLSSAETNIESYFDKSGFGLFDQALFDGLKRDQNGKMAVDPEGDGFTFDEIHSYILAWKKSHQYHYTDEIVYKMDIGDPILYTDDLFIPVAFQTSDFTDGMPTDQKRNPAAAALYFLLFD